MRTAILILGLLILAAGGILFFRSQRQAPPSPPAAAAVNEDKPVGVNELMKAPDKYSGQIHVTGVVSTVNTERGRFALIDRCEFAECGTTTCAPLSLPVQWRGQMPAVQDLVVLRGEIQTAGGKLIFAASDLRKFSPGPAEKEKPE